MCRINFKRPHRFSYREVCQRLSAAAEGLRSRYQLEVAVQDGYVDLSGKGLRGRLAARPADLSVDVELLGPMAMIKQRVEASLRQAVEEHFN